MNNETRVPKVEAHEGNNIRGFDVIRKKNTRIQDSIRTGVVGVNVGSFVVADSMRSAIQRTKRRVDLVPIAKNCNGCNRQI